MQEMGRILKIEGKTVTIQGGELGGCFGCVNEECRANGNVFSAENHKDLALAVGDLVEISTGAGATASDAAFVFLPPLLAFAAAFILASALFPQSSEAARASIGVAGLALGFLGVYWYRKANPAKDGPIVTRTVPEKETIDGD